MRLRGFAPRSALFLTVLAVLLVEATPVAAETVEIGIDTPPPGGVAAGFAETSDPVALTDALPFEVDSIAIFDLESQLFHTFVPGAPAHVNAISEHRFGEPTIVWVRRAEPAAGAAPAVDGASTPADPSAGGGPAGAGGSQPSSGSPVPATFPVPAPGDLTVGIAGTSSPTVLAAAQAFDVGSIIVHDVPAQTFLVHIPGAPDRVNSLTDSTLSPGSVTWIRRASAVPPAGTAANPMVSPPTAPPPAGVAGPPTSVAAPTAAGTVGPQSPPETPSSSAPAAAVTPEVTATPRPANTPRATATPRPTPAQVLRRTTYERGEDRIESAHTSTSYGLGTTREASRSGSSAGVALLRPGDGKSQGGFRAEWHGVDSVRPGVERWHGISYYLPRDWHQGDNPKTFDQRIIFQWHATGSFQNTGQTSPIYGLHLAGSENSPRYVFYRKDAYRDDDGRLRASIVPLWRSDAGTNRWTDFAFNTIWSTSDGGKVVLYVNGKQVYSMTGPTLAGKTNVYSKWGAYGQPTRILFDEVRIAEGPGQLGAVSP